ncbi:MAG: hypothetical protein Q4B15_07215, partial [Lachnospiraceae bacterium]|nr:hypothetical protein [Lachnospiraceae bacterium]
MKRKSIRMMYSFGCALIGACMAVSSPALTVFAASPDEQAETAVEVKEAAAPVSTAYRLTQIVIHMGENWRLENALLGKDGNWYISQQTLERYTGYTLDPENMTLRDSSDNLIGIDLEKSTLRTEQSASSVEVSVGALPVYGGQVWFPAHQILPMTGVKADVKEGELYLESYSDSPEKQDRGEPDLSKLGEAVKPEEWKAYWNNYLREILTGEESQNPEEVHLSFADLTGDGTQEMLIAQPAGENYNYEFEAVSFKALRLTDADSRCEEIYEYEYNGYSTLHNDTDIGLCFDGDNKAGILKTDDTVWQGYAS